jgi:hypothetical protein
MKKRITILAVVFFACISFLYSQNKKVEDIREFCEELDGMIDLEESGRNYIMIHEINFESNLRAIGKQYTSIKFFYTQQQDTLIEKGDASVFLDIYKPPVKVTTDYNIAMSQKVFVDYYPDESGNLIFYRRLTTGAFMNGEEFIYFENDSPVNMKYKTENIENNDLYNLMNYDKSSDFTQADIKRCKTILQNWNDYKKIFERIVFAEKIDKKNEGE